MERTTETIDETHGIFRQLVASPGHVLIRAGDEQLVRIQGRTVISIQVEHCQRHSTLLGRCDKAVDIDGRVETQQRELWPHRVIK